VLGKVGEHKNWILTLAYILWDVRHYMCKIYLFYIVKENFLYCNYVTFYVLIVVYNEDMSVCKL